MAKYHISKSFIRKWTINISLSAASLYISLVIVELILRSLYPTHTDIQYRIPHPTRGWVLLSDASYAQEIPGEAVFQVTYNSKGFRDTEHTIEKPEGVFRILVLGDSYMEAYSVDIKESFSQQLEELTLVHGYTNIEVLNMGVGGYGTLQEYLTFVEVGQEYAPDLVLFAFYISNDVRNNSYELDSILGNEHFKVSSRPYLNWHEQNVWEITQVDIAGAQQRYTEALAEKNSFMYQLKQSAFFFPRIRERVRSIIKSQQSLENLQNEKTVEANLAFLGVSYCEEPPEFTRAWRLTERILERLKAETDSREAKLVVFTVPARPEVEIDHQNKKISSAAEPEMLCLEEAPGYARLSNILINLGIDQINLLSDFRKVNREDSVRLFWQGNDRHWNPEGHALAAEQVLSELIEMKLLPYNNE